MKKKITAPIIIVNRHSYTVFSYVHVFSEFKFVPKGKRSAFSADVELV